MKFNLLRKARLLNGALILAASLAGSSGAQAQHIPKPRIIITADPELDDNNSLIRLLLYSNELNIEGLAPGWVKGTTTRL